MGLTVDEMLEKIDSPLLSQYMAYDRLTGLDNEKLEFMIAQLTALTANIAGGKNKVSDFLPVKTKPVSVIDKIRMVFSGSKCN